MGAVTVEKSVGFGGRNKPIDVAVIQRLLRAYFTEVATPVKGRSSRVITPPIAVDGECTTGLVDLIKDVQSDDMGMKHPDGRIDPYGKTLQTITSALHCTAGGAKTILFGPAPGNTDILPKVDAGRFRKLFPRQIGEGLTITKGEDLLGFFGFLQKDTAIADIRWAAYMLATVYTETWYSFMPIEEKDKGGGESYAAEKEVIDTQGYRGAKNATYKNRYYGRGYCQLTGPRVATADNNYQKIGKALGFGDELYINPDKTLDKKIAYDIISYGMRNGTFTGHKLSDHISGKKCDYENARRIINGLDRYDEIARYAREIELLLRLCVGSAATAPVTCFRQ